MNTTLQAPDGSIVQVDLSTKESDLKSLYILFYRTGNNPRPQEKYFLLPRLTDFRDIIDTFKTYCTNCGYRFVKIEKFLSDMAEDERRARQVS